MGMLPYVMVFPQERLAYNVYTHKQKSYRVRGIFGGGFNLTNHISITKLNVRHLGCKHGFLSIQYSKLPIKNLANCIFRPNCQIFDSPIIPRIWYQEYKLYYVLLTLHIGEVLPTQNSSYYSKRDLTYPNTSPNLCPV